MILGQRGWTACPVNCSDIQRGCEQSLPLKHCRQTRPLAHFITWSLNSFNISAAPKVWCEKREQKKRYVNEKSFINVQQRQRLSGYYDACLHHHATDTDTCRHITCTVMHVLNHDVSTEPRGGSLCKANHSTFSCPQPVTPTVFTKHPLTSCFLCVPDLLCRQPVIYSDYKTTQREDV